MVGVTQLCRYIHLIVHFKSVSCMVYKRHLKAVILKNIIPICSCDTQGTIANSLTCVQLHKRAEKIAVMLMERGHLQDGDHVALVYPPGKKRGCADQPVPEGPCITPIGAQWPCCITTKMGPDPGLAHRVDCVLRAV